VSAAELDPRRRELAAGLARVEDRVEAACASAGRPRSAVTLIVVTKTFPAADVRLLAGLGVREVGESRDQEASAKAQECADLDLVWHFVGRLQTNKARSVASYAGAVHTIDRPALITALNGAAERVGRPLDALVQVSLDGDPERGGVAVQGLAMLADQVAATEQLRLRGVMAVAPQGGDPLDHFAVLQAAALRLQAAHPQADWISAGMSGDLEAAVARGATHLRVGSAVLGSRPLLR